MGKDSDLPVPSTGNASKNEGHDGVTGGSQPTVPSASSTSGQDQGLSKNQLKKRKRWQKQLELKKRRKEQEREVKRQKAKRYEVSQASTISRFENLPTSMTIEILFYCIERAVT